MTFLRIALATACAVTAQQQWLAPARAQSGWLAARDIRAAAPAIATPPFTATLSNTTPLAFGMAAEDASRALLTPLSYITGRPGDEILLAIRTEGGSGFFNRRDRLYLQFRNGRLTGWKGDWGHRRAWQ